MRQFLVLVILFASLVAFLGCSDNSFTHSLDENDEEISQPDSFSLIPYEYQLNEKLNFNISSLFLSDTPQQLIDYLFSNEIDIAMKEEGETLFSTQEINEWVMKYHTIWTNEMNIIYDNLLLVLHDDARKLLEYSQISWEHTNTHNSYLWHEIFSISKGRGTGDSSLVFYQNLQRTRERAFLLAEYYYWLTGSFSFTQAKPYDNSNSLSSRNDCKYEICENG